MHDIRPCHHFHMLEEVASSNHTERSDSSRGVEVSGTQSWLLSSSALTAILKGPGPIFTLTLNKLFYPQV